MDFESEASKKGYHSDEHLLSLLSRYRTFVVRSLPHLEKLIDSALNNDYQAFDELFCITTKSWTQNSALIRACLFECAIFESNECQMFKPLTLQSAFTTFVENVPEKIEQPKKKSRKITREIKILMEDSQHLRKHFGTMTTARHHNTTEQDREESSHREKLITKSAPKKQFIQIKEIKDNLNTFNQTFASAQFPLSSQDYDNLTAKNPSSLLTPSVLTLSRIQKSFHGFVSSRNPLLMAGSKLLTIQDNLCDEDFTFDDEVNSIYLLQTDMKRAKTELQKNVHENSSFLLQRIAHEPLKNTESWFLWDILQTAFTQSGQNESLSEEKTENFTPPSEKQENRSIDESNTSTEHKEAPKLFHPFLPSMIDQSEKNLGLCEYGFFPEHCYNNVPELPSYQLDFSMVDKNSINSQLVKVISQFAIECGFQTISSSALSVLVEVFESFISKFASIYKIRSTFSPPINQMDKALLINQALFDIGLNGIVDIGYVQQADEQKKKKNENPTQSIKVESKLTEDSEINSLNAMFSGLSFFSDFNEVLSDIAHEIEKPSKIESENEIEIEIEIEKNKSKRKQKNRNRKPNKKRSKSKSNNRIETQTRDEKDEEEEEEIRLHSEENDDDETRNSELIHPPQPEDEVASGNNSEEKKKKLRKRSVRKRKR